MIPSLPKPHTDDRRQHPQALTDMQVDVLRHACLNKRFMADPYDQDCIELHKLGLFRFAGEIAWCGPGHLYYPTEQGRIFISNVEVRERVRKNAIKKTRSKQRYQAFLDSGVDMTFGEYLRATHPSSLRK